MIRVGVLKIDLHVTNSMSLKEKRFVLMSIKDRIRKSFNVSISEVDNHDKWQAATIGVSCVSNDKRHIDSTLNRIKDFFEKDKNIIVNDYQVEII
ncbi:MAG: DUF503 domain-containing protein [Candidatus Omnitrophota bacterium]